MSDTEYLNEFYKFVSTDSILVVTKTGVLIRLYCPFQVASKVAFPDIEAGEIVWVEEVRVTEEGKDIYVINSNGYYANYFYILDDALFCNDSDLTLNQCMDLNRVNETLSILKHSVYDYVKFQL